MTQQTPDRTATARCSDVFIHFPQASHPKPATQALTLRTPSLTEGPETGASPQTPCPTTHQHEGEPTQGSPTSHGLTAVKYNRSQAAKQGAVLGDPFSPAAGGALPWSLRGARLALGCVHRDHMANTRPTEAKHPQD